MEKILTEFFFFVLVIGFTTAELPRCTKQSHCKENECCSKRFMSNKAYCVPHRRIGQMCLVDPKMVNGTYSINCPCERGLECRKPEFYSEDGQLLYSENPECILEGTDLLPMEFYIRRRSYRRNYNGYGSNEYGSNGYGSNGYVSNGYGSNGYGSNGYGYSPMRNPSEVEFGDYGSRANAEAFVPNGLATNYVTTYRRR